MNRGTPQPRCAGERSKPTVKARRILVGSLPAGEHRLETGLRENALHLLALVALDLDAAVFHRAADAAGLLHFFRELLFLRESDSDEISGHRDAFAAAVRGLADDVHPAAVGVFLAALGGFRGKGGSGIRSGRQIAEPGQRSERVRRQAGGFACFVSTHPGHGIQSPVPGRSFLIISIASDSRRPV
jgi:hypothetical protein